MKRSRTNFRMLIRLATFAFFTVTSFIGCKEVATVDVTNLACEYLTNPSGIDANNVYSIFVVSLRRQVRVLVIFTDVRFQCSSWNWFGDNSEVSDPYKTGINSPIGLFGALVVPRRPVLSLSAVCCDFRLLCRVGVSTLIFVFMHSFMDWAMLVMVWHLTVENIPWLPGYENVSY